MINKLLQVYENKILNERTKNNLGRGGWLYIILSGVALLSFWIFEILHLYIESVISMGILILLTIIFSIISNKVVKIDEQDLKDFKSETVDKFAAILKETGLGDTDTLDVIISQCKEYENNKSDGVWSERFKTIFTMLIYPILTAVSAVIVKNMSDKYMIEWSIFIIGMIIIIFIMVALIYPVVADYTNKYKRIAKMMRQDLEYIRVQNDN